MLARRIWTLSAFVVTAAACSSPSPLRARSSARATDAPAVPPTAAVTIGAIADEYYRARLAAYPEEADWTSVPDKQYSRLSDHSPAALARWRTREDRWLAQLRRIKASSLAAGQRVLHAMLLEEVESNIGLRVCKQELWPATPLSGWQVAYPLMLSRQPVDTDAARAAALTRWRTMPAALETEIANMRRGMKAGYTVPRGAVKRIIAQIDGLMVASIAASAFASPATRGGDAAFARTWYALAKTKLYPAMRAYSAFLRREYLAVARTNAAISAHPSGRHCYAAQLRRHTTVRRSPDEIFKRGSALVARNEAEIASIGAKLFGTRTLAATMAAIKADSRLALPSGDAVLSFARATSARATAAAPRWFVDVPAIPGVVEPWPRSLDQPGAGDHYEAPADGKGRGIFRISLRQPHRSRPSLEVTTVHELIPGHHFQMAFEISLGQRHPVLQLLGNTAYGEGWARYAEALAEEMGVFRIDASKVVRRSWPGRGMVADVGFHLRGWSRARVVTYLGAAGRFPTAYVATLPDRIAMWPGQLTAYDTGAAEILALRREAERRLGAHFDIRAFHTRVLENGTVPLWYLRDHVQAWINREAARTRLTPTPSGAELTRH